MSSEEKEKREDEAGCCGFGSGQKDFQKMFEMMSKCCAGREGPPDCSAMMEKMKEACCGPATDKNGADSRKP